MRTLHPMFADMIPSGERLVTSPAAFSVATLALIVTCVITIVLIRRRNLKREP